jgi:YD repeat-containing protein
MIPRRMNTGWSTFEYTYDVLNHLKTVKDPLNRIDPLNNTTTYAYDERDLLWRVTDRKVQSFIGILIFGIYLEDNSG